MRLKSGFLRELPRESDGGRDFVFKFHFLQKLIAQKDSVRRESPDQVSALLVMRGNQTGLDLRYARKVRFRRNSGCDLRKIAIHFRVRPAVIVAQDELINFRPGFDGEILNQLRIGHPGWTFGHSGTRPGERHREG